MNNERIIPVTGPENNINGQNKYSSDEANAKNENTQNNDYLDQLLRLQAEFTNYRKRVEKERETLFPVAKSVLILKLLPIADDFDRLLDHESCDDHTKDGFRLIAKNLMKVLTDEGLEPIPAVGELFNPDVHEAISVEETDEESDGLVVDEWQKGYRFSGRLLRPSRVKVGQYKQKVGDG